MKWFLKIILLLSSLHFIASCGSINEVSSKKLIAEHRINAPLEFGFNTALYRAKVKLYGKFYSGLFLFKYTPETKIHHVVFLSEIGLTLFELKFANDKFTNVNKSVIFDNERAIKTLINDLELLLHNIENMPNAVFVSNEDNERLKRARKYKKVYYFFNQDNQVFRIKRNSLFSSLNVTTAIVYDNSIPKHISFDHKGIKLNIDLILLKLN